MKNINFDVSKEDFELISQITKRALNKIEIRNATDRVCLQMDITAVHNNGNPLKLNDLLNANDFNFFHDVAGIIKNINRSTGKLENYFLPRFSA